MSLEFGNNSVPEIFDLPNGYELMFIGRYVEQADKRFPADGFVAVIAKTEALVRGEPELFENASVAFCGIEGGDMQIFVAWHCHKYKEGGMLEFLKPSSSFEDEPTIFWYPPGYKYDSSLHLNGWRGEFQKEWFFK